MNNNILVTVGHPDDLSLMCGGSIKRFTEEKYNVHVLNFTNGGGARLKSYLGGSGEDRRPLIKDECGILGVQNYKSFDFPDNMMDTVPLLDLIQCIEEYLIKNGLVPDLVFTHHPGCLNIDHRKIYEATITCFRGMEKYKQIMILSGEIASSTEWNKLQYPFIPNVYIDISKYIEHKCKAFEVYQTEIKQHPHPRNSENLRNRAKVAGTECGAQYAERFELVRLSI